MSTKTVAGSVVKIMTVEGNKTVEIEGRHFGDYPISTVNAKILRDVKYWLMGSGDQNCRACNKRKCNGGCK